VFDAIRENLAWKVVERFGVTKEGVEKKKDEFLEWLARNGKLPQWNDWFEFAADWTAFRKDTAGAASLTDWIIGLIIAAILGVGVALPIVVETVSNVMGNLSGITATVVGVIPVAVAITLLLIFLGR